MAGRAWLASCLARAQILHLVRPRPRGHAQKSGRVRDEKVERRRERQLLAAMLGMVRSRRRDRCRAWSWEQSAAVSKRKWRGSRHGREGEGTDCHSRRIEEARGGEKRRPARRRSLSCSEQSRLSEARRQEPGQIYLPLLATTLLHFTVAPLAADTSRRRSSHFSSLVLITDQTLAETWA